MSRRTNSPWILAVTAGLALSCSTSSDRMTDPEDPETGEPTCETVTLSTDHAIPLDAVVVTGLPESFGADTYARVITDDGVTTSGVPVLFRNDEVRLMTPVHPIEYLDGGVVTLEFVHEDEVCGPYPFTIDPLPEAPGAFRNAVTELQSLIAAWASAIGRSTEELLASDPSTLEPHELGLLLAIDASLNEDNPNALPFILDGTAPALDGATDFELLDRLTARSGLAAFLAGERADVTEAAGRASIPRRIRIESCVDIPSVTRLDEVMRLSAAAAQEATGASRDVLDKTGTALATVGVVVPPSPIKAGLVGLGATMWSVGSVSEAMANTLPSALSSIDYGAAPNPMFEDHEPGTISTIILSATSTGWSADKAVMEGLLQFLKVGRSAQGFFNSETSSAFGSAAFSAGTLIANQVIGETDTSVLEFDPCAWSVDATNDAYVEAEVIEGSSVAVTGFEYEWKSAGSTLVRVATREGLFGNRTAAKSVLIESKEIQVTISPEFVVVEPGEDVEFSVAVECAVDSSVEWLPPSYFTPFEGGATMQTPTDNSLYPITITVRSTSTGGARGVGGAPDREADAIVSLLTLEIPGDGLCMEPGEWFTFEPIIEGTDQTEMVWQVIPPSAGTFSGNTFTASSDGTDEVEIVGSLLAFPEVQDGIFITTSGCTCFWTADLGGALSGSFSGDWAEWSNVPGFASFIIGPSYDGAPIFPLVNVFLLQQLPAGATGVFPCVMSFVVSPEEAASAGDSGGSTVFDISINDDGRVIGRVTGTMITNIDGEDQPVTIDMFVRALEAVMVEDPQPCRP